MTVNPSDLSSTLPSQKSSVAVIVIYLLVTPPLVLKESPLGKGRKRDILFQ